MRKRFLTMAVTAAALTMATGITAFAGSWKTDAMGTYYENDDGTRPVYAGWFTDPADGAVYGMDPDGYVMVNSEFGGYRTDDTGKKIEKSEADLAREEERKAQLASRPNPSKATAAAELSAKSATAAISTTRAAYQAEIKVFMDKIFIATRTARTDTTIGTAINADNTMTEYSFRNADGYKFITATIWRSTSQNAVNYKEQAIDLSYHYDAATMDTANYDSCFDQLVVASVGDTEGVAVIDYIKTEREAGNTEFTRSSKTDVGNSYTLTYKNNVAKLSVTCSGIVASTEDATDTAADNTADTAETAVTTSVIVAGQGNSTTDTVADTSEDTASEDTTDNSTEDTAADATAE